MLESVTAMMNQLAGLENRAKFHDYLPKPGSRAKGGELTSNTTRNRRLKAMRAATTGVKPPSEKFLQRRRKQMLEGKLGREAKELALSITVGSYQTSKDARLAMQFGMSIPMQQKLAEQQYVKGELTNALETRGQHPQNKESEHSREAKSLGRDSELSA
jgi:hypothetical protein